MAAVERLRPEELARPAALRPLLTLLGCGDPGVERLALALLTALVDSSAEAATLVRCSRSAALHWPGDLSTEWMVVSWGYMLKREFSASKGILAHPTHPKMLTDGRLFWDFLRMRMVFTVIRIMLVPVRVTDTPPPGPSMSQSTVGVDMEVTSFNANHGCGLEQRGATPAVLSTGASAASRRSPARPAPRSRRRSARGTRRPPWRTRRRRLPPSGPCTGC